MNHAYYAIFYQNYRGQFTVVFPDLDEMIMVSKTDIEDAIPHARQWLTEHLQKWIDGAYRFEEVEFPKPSSLKKIVGMKRGKDSKDIHIIKVISHEVKHFYTVSSRGIEK